MALTKKQIADTLSRHGIPMAPKDHPVYSEPPSTYFINHKPKPEKADDGDAEGEK